MPRNKKYVYICSPKRKVIPCGIYWRDAGVVDRGGLENRCARAGTQGSNPCLSAKKVRKRKLSDLRAKKGGMRTLMGSLSRSACVARIPVFPQKDTG